MKSTRYNRISAQAGFIFSALLGLTGLQTTANAQLTLSYEEAGGGHSVGEIYSGPFKINFGAFDMGSTYNALPVGTSAGFGAGGGAASVQSGINTLDGAQLSGATGAVTTQTTINGVGQGAGSNGAEDSWGIARVTQITDLANRVVWSENGKNQQITVMFYGEKDFYVTQVLPDTQEINGVGLHADFWLQNKPAYTPFDADLGSAGRNSLADYDNVTDGVKILSTVSTAGFIHNAGTAGGLATEFSSRFNPNAGGDGQAYLSVTGGTEADRFNTNGFSTDTGYGFVPGNTADLFAQFTTFANPGVNDWLVSAQDPVLGTFAAVPEPSTYGFAAAGLLVAASVLRRRFSKKVVA